MVYSLREKKLIRYCFQLFLLSPCFFFLIAVNTLERLSDLSGADCKRHLHNKKYQQNTFRVVLAIHGIPLTNHFLPCMGPYLGKK